MISIDGSPDDGEDCCDVCALPAWIVALAEWLVEPIVFSLTHPRPVGGAAGGAP